MHHNLVPILVIGILTLGIYRLFELFVRKSERLAIIEKLTSCTDLSEIQNSLNRDLFRNAQKSSWALKISLLLIGIGLGLIVAYMIEYISIGGDFTQDIPWKFHRSIETIYLACVTVFGGIGLLVSYLIERKNSKKE